MLTLNTIAARSQISVSDLQEAARSAGLAKIASAPSEPISEEVALLLMPKLPPKARKYVEVAITQLVVAEPSPSVGSLRPKAEDRRIVPPLDSSLIAEIALLEPAKSRGPVPTEAQLGIKLGKITARSVASGGWFANKATKVRVADEGFKSEAFGSLHRLARPEGKTPSLQGVLSDMKTLQKHLDRLVDLGAIKPNQADDVLLGSLQPAVEKLSNNELSSVWQTLCSSELTNLKAALEHRAFGPGKEQDSKAALGNLMSLEAVVLREVSRRVALEQAPAHGSDISSSNLHALVEVASQSATSKEKQAAKTSETYQKRGVDGLDPKKVGDVMRGAELTMNVNFEALFGFATEERPAIIDDPAFKQWPNAHHLKARNVPGFTDVYMARRVHVENSLWPELSGHNVDANERPVYAALNLQQRTRGAAPSGSYGHCVMVMKPAVKQRCTYTVDDTFFAVRLQLSPERIERFFTLASGLGAHIDPRMAMAFADPTSPETKALTAWFQKLGTSQRPSANDLEGLGVALAESNPDANYRARFGKDKEGDDLRLEALAVEVFADLKSTRDATASYDNLESLLPHMNTATADGLVHAAVSGERRGAACLGTNYIEAQIQGPLDIGRDVACIRIPMELLEDHANGDPQALAALKQRIDAFSARHGIEVQIVDDHTFEKNDAQVEDLRSDAEQFSLGLDARAYDDACAKLMSSKPDVINALVDKAVLQGKYTAASKLSPDVKMIQGATLGRLMTLAREEMDKEKSRGSSAGTPPDIRAERAFNAAAAKILSEKQRLLDHLDTLPFDNPAQKAAFATWVVSAKALRDPNELTVIHRHAFALRDGMRTLAKTKASAADVLAQMDTLHNATARDIVAWSKSANKSEFGKDDLITTISRTTSLAVSLLSATGDMDDSERGGLLDTLTSPAIAQRKAAMDLLATSLSGPSDDEKQRMIGANEIISLTALAVAKSLGRDERAVMTALKPPGRDELEEAEIPASVRADLAKLFPLSIAALDKEHRAAPTLKLELMPKTATAVSLGLPERRAFLLSVLDPYLQREGTFEKGSATHGRGHVTRAFIFANVMGNILNERGLSVDVGAVCMAISGHDMARKGGGADLWEAESAQQTRDAMTKHFGKVALGESYIKAVTQSIDGHGEPTTVEDMLLTAADSLDIGRVSELDFERFPFLKNSIVVGQVEVAVDDNLRQQLAAEADLLQRLTNPLCAIRGTMNRLLVTAMDERTSEPDREQMLSAVNELKTKAAALLDEERSLGHEDFVAKIEATIREQPKSFPLLSRYYSGGTFGTT